MCSGNLSGWSWTFLWHENYTRICICFSEWSLNIFPAQNVADRRWKPAGETSKCLLTIIHAFRRWAAGSRPQRLKAAVHFTVGRICQKLGEDHRKEFSRQTVAAITETTFRQCGEANKVCQSRNLLSESTSLLKMSPKTFRLLNT